MSLTSDDFEEFVSSDPDDDETVPLGQALSELGLDVEVDSVEAVRDVRERLYVEQAQYHGVHAVDTRRHLGKYPRLTAV